MNSLCFSAFIFIFSIMNIYYFTISKIVFYRNFVKFESLYLEKRLRTFIKSLSSRLMWIVTLESESSSVKVRLLNDSLIFDLTVDIKSVASWSIFKLLMSRRPAIWLACQPPRSEQMVCTLLWFLSAYETGFVLSSVPAFFSLLTPIH